jgi:hypothetical protein
MSADKRQNHAGKALTPPDLSPEFLTTREYGNRVHLSDATVKRKCDRGEIACIVVSERGDRRIPASEVSRLQAEAEANRRATPDEPSDLVDRHPGALDQPESSTSAGSDSVNDRSNDLSSQ